MAMETVIWGIPKGETDPIHEKIMYGGGLLLSEDNVDRIKASATNMGYHSFRVVNFDPLAMDVQKAFKDSVNV